MSKVVSWWRITHIRGSKAERIGVVTAADAAKAIKLAIKQYNITDPEQQTRLAATPTDERW